MIDVTLFSIFSFASAFAPSLVALLILRTLLGFAMGGEWGIGASLVMETIPARLRGPGSGWLQSAYPTGYILASRVYFLLFDMIGWRGMFNVRIASAILVLLNRMHGEETHTFQAKKERKN